MAKCLELDSTGCVLLRWLLRSQTTPPCLSVCGGGEEEEEECVGGCLWMRGRCWIIVGWPTHLLHTTSMLQCALSVNCCCCCRLRLLPMERSVVVVLDRAWLDLERCCLCDVDEDQQTFRPFLVTHALSVAAPRTEKGTYIVYIVVPSGPSSE